MNLVDVLVFGAACVVVWHAIKVAAVAHEWTGQPVQFLAWSIGWALTTAGSLAVVLKPTLGGPALLMGLAIIQVSDRRRHRN